MVRNFKGVVKVADVQAEFDNLLNAINDKIDTYNSSLDIEDVDYNNGGPDLAAYGYTLSVGGLKAVLDAYDGAILGANILRISNNQYVISEGLYIKNRTVTKLPSKILNGTGNTVYFDSVNRTYTFIKGDGILSTPWESPQVIGTEIPEGLGTVNVSTLYPEAGDFGTINASAVFHSNIPQWYTAVRDSSSGRVDNGLSCTWELDETTDITSISFMAGMEVASGQTGNVFQSRVVFLDEDNNYIGGFFPINDWRATGLDVREVSETNLNYKNVRFIVISLSSNANSSDGTYHILLGNIKAAGTRGGGSGGGDILISPINSNRISRLCNRPNATNESIPDYKVTIESQSSGGGVNVNQYLSNSDKGQFFSGSAGRNCAINLLGTQVAYHQWHGDRSDSYHEPINFLFVPKGLPNPYGGLSGETRFAMQKVFNYILKRPER